jgi:DNA-binding MurR/RpiR family transcriptional regulator
VAPVTNSARPDVLAALRSLLPTLPPAEARAARYVIDHSDAVLDLSITQLSALADAGEATVMRLCSRLGLRGYGALKIGIAQSRPSDRTEPIARLIGDVGRDSTLEEIVERVVGSEIRDIEDTRRLLDLERLSDVVGALRTSERIVAYGAGPSGFVALDFAQKLGRLGRIAHGHNDPHLAIAAAALMNPNDVAVAFSYSGRTRDSLEFLKAAKARSAVSVAITGTMGSPVAKVADHAVLTAANEGNFRTGATSSRIAQLVVVDILFVALAADRFDDVRYKLAAAYAALEDHRV